MTGLAMMFIIAIVAVPLLELLSDIASRIERRVEERRFARYEARVKARIARKTGVVIGDLDKLDLIK